MSSRWAFSHQVEQRIKFNVMKCARAGFVVLCMLAVPLALASCSGSRSEQEVAVPPGPTASPTVSLTDARAAAAEEDESRSEVLLERLSPAELDRYQTILRTTLGTPEYVTDDIRLEFWELLDKIGYTEDQANAMGRYLILNSTAYQSAFWRDVLASLEIGQPQMSAERRELEAYYLDQGLITQARLDASAALVRDIVAERPIQMPGQDTPMVLGREWAINVLANLQYIEDQLDLLFTRPD